ncbi:MAG: restriction endonuclease subunit S [Muribaculaceae bacterium]|nr:restriction endonuclease subunit S [Muribaculaceae bacterium]
MREGWVKKSISEICDKASSNIAQNKIADIDGDYPVYGASGYVHNVDFYHRDTPYIGIVKDGSGVGRVNIYPAYSSLLGTMQYIIPKEGYQLGYVAYALKGLNLSSFASGAAIPHIYFKDYGKCKIDVPPFIEQERIIAELDLLSGIIEKKKEQLKAYDQLAQSIFYTMFGDPIDNPKGWETKKLGEVCSLKAGKAIKAAELKEKQDNLYPCYGGNGIRGFIDKVSHKEDFPIIGRQGALCGNVNFARGPFYATEHAVVVTPLIEMNMIWLFYELKCSNLEQYAHGVAQPGIAVNDLNPIHFPLPPLSLQQEFAEKIEAIERQKALVQQSIDETQTMFDYTMDKYFG